MLPRDNRTQVFLLTPLENGNFGYYSPVQLFPTLNVYVNLLQSLLQMKIGGPTPKGFYGGPQTEVDPFIKTLAYFLISSLKDNFDSLHLSSKSCHIFLKQVTILLTCVLIESSIMFIGHVHIQIRNI